MILIIVQIILDARLSGRDKRNVTIKSSSIEKSVILYFLEPVVRSLDEVIHRLRVMQCIEYRFYLLDKDLSKLCTTGSSMILFDAHDDFLTWSYLKLSRGT